MTESRGPLSVVIVVLLFGGLFAALGYYWYRQTYRPGKAAASALDTLSVALARSTTQPGGRVTLQGLWVPLSFRTNDNVHIFTSGTWNGTPATIRFALDVGLPDDSWLGAGDSMAAYQPPTMALRLTTGRVVAKGARLATHTKSQLDFNAFASKLGMGQFVRQFSDNLFAHGDPDEVSRFFRPAVREQVIGFPRNLFAAPAGDLVIKDGEVRMCWEGHETDPKVVEAGFRLLEAIASN